jgi:hypothetical protein
MGFIHYSLLRKMIVKNVLILLILSVSSSLILGAVSLLCRETVQMVDFSAVRYGFPCYYVEHVLVNFAGSTNRWVFVELNFIVDTTMYFLLSLGLWSAIFLLRIKKRTFSFK